MNIETAAPAGHLERVLAHFRRSPLFRQAEAELRAQEEARRTELAKERHRLVLEKQERVRALGVSRDCAQERLELAEAELERARSAFREADAALARSADERGRLDAVEAQLRETCSTSIAEVRSRLLDLFSRLPSFHVIARSRASLDIGGEVIWTNTAELGEARGEIQAAMQALQPLELEPLSEPEVQERLSKLMARAHGAVERIPRVPAPGWADRAESEALREAARAQQRTRAEERDRRDRLAEERERNRRRAEGTEP